MGPGRGSRVPVVAMRGSDGADRTTARSSAHLDDVARRLPGRRRSTAPATSGPTPTPTPWPRRSPSSSAERRRDGDVTAEERARRVVGGALRERLTNAVGAVDRPRPAAATRPPRRPAAGSTTHDLRHDHLDDQRGDDRQDDGADDDRQRDVADRPELEPQHRTRRYRIGTAGRDRGIRSGRRCQTNIRSPCPAGCRRRCCRRREPAARDGAGRAWPLDGDARRAALAAVAARWPRYLDVWAALGDQGRDEIERYAYYRVGYHRGLDALRANGWRGSGYVRWTAPDQPGLPARPRRTRRDGRRRSARTTRPSASPCSSPSSTPTARRRRDRPAPCCAAVAAGGWGRTRRSSRSAASPMAERVARRAGGSRLRARSSSSAATPRCSPALGRRGARRRWPGEGPAGGVAHRAARPLDDERRRRRACDLPLARSRASVRTARRRAGRRRRPSTWWWRATDRAAAGAGRVASPGGLPTRSRRAMGRRARGRSTTLVAALAAVPVAVDPPPRCATSTRRTELTAAEARARVAWPRAVQEIDVDQLADRLDARRSADRRARARRVHRRPRSRAPCSSRWRRCPDHLDAFSGDGPTYVICQSGARSRRACEHVAALGLADVEVVNVAGGTLAWLASGGRPSAGTSPRDRSLDRPARPISTTSSTSW